MVGNMGGNMIIVRFQGGLGNQMFQYAFLKALERVYPNVDIKADFTSYELNQYHYGLELSRVFNININKKLIEKRSWNYQNMFRHGSIVNFYSN